MTWNGSGLYERLYNWVTDRDAATPIDATKMDAEQDGIVGALNDIVQQNEPFQGPILAQDGTVSSPGYTFDSDLDLGMYRVGLNSGALVAGSAAPLTWTATKVVLLGLDIDTIAESTPAAGVTIDGVLLKDGGATLASATLTTADINGGTIDGAVIGGASAAAGTFTNIAGTSMQLSNTTSSLHITSTDAGASLGPYIYLIHDSASPANGDETGEIYFRGNDSLGNLTNYSRIRGLSTDVTNAAEDGALYFYNTTAGVENIDLRLTNGGVTLAHLGNTKLVTYANGVTVTGHVGATTLSGDGGSITGMSATQLTSGTVPAARLTEATAAQIRDGTASVLVTPANMEAASEEVTLTDAATIAVDWSTFLTGKVTLAGNRTLGAPTNAEPGTWRTIRVVQDGTGSRTLGFSAVYLTQDNETITLSTGAADKDTLYIYCETTSLFHVTAAYNWS
jgi:hypothetical protein